MDDNFIKMNNHNLYNGGEFDIHVDEFDDEYVMDIDIDVIEEA